jgi:hypothetical protein
MELAMIGPRRMSSMWFFVIIAVVEAFVTSRGQ